jgi:uncharacterized protein (TIGR02679 family)
VTDDQLDPLWVELARRFGDGPPPVRVTVRGMSVEQRRALADLLGMDRLPPPTARVPVHRLATALKVDGQGGLRAAVEARVGPITDRGEAREAVRHQRESLWTWLAEQTAGLPSGDALLPWLGTVRAAGVPRGDIEGHRRRLAGALAVLKALPADGTGLAALADDILGDPHGLDRGRPAAALVLEAVATARGRGRPGDAEAVRRLWEEVGVVPDPLSSTVLTVGLRPAARNPVAAWLRATTDAGEPAVLTLAQLRRWPLEPLPAGSGAFVVENPSVIAAAAAARRPFAPLICSSGRPTIAVVTLLRQLSTAGAQMFQHADFDAAGLGITSWLAERAGTIPWRMGAPDYLAALTVDRARVPLTQRLPAAPWDPRLPAVMEAHGVAVHEEELRAELLSDLGPSGLASPR